MVLLVFQVLQFFDHHVYPFVVIALQVKKGMSLTSVRKLAQGIAFVGPAACMISCAVLTPTIALTSATAGAWSNIKSNLSMSF